MQVTALNILTAVSQVCALSQSFVKEQAAKGLFMLCFFSFFFFLLFCFFKPWMHCVTIKVSIMQSHYLETHPQEATEAHVQTNVKIRSTLSSNKHWRFELQASLFQNWSEYLQAGRSHSCASAIQYSISVKEEGQSMDIVLHTRAAFVCMEWSPKACLSKDFFFFSHHH